MAMNQISDSEIITEPRRLNVNRYATKKTIAQGMLDVALLTANASQLRYILQSGAGHQFYTLLVILISLSIVLQIMTGALLLALGSLNIDSNKHQVAADVLNDISVMFIFIISLINIVISGFGIHDADSTKSATSTTIL